MYRLPVAAPLGVYGAPGVPVPYSPAPYGAPTAAAHPGAYPPGTALEAWGGGPAPAAHPRAGADRRSDGGRDVRRGGRGPYPSAGEPRTDSVRGAQASRAPCVPAAEENKVFVGSLSQQTTTDSLAEYMKQFGAVQDVVVMTDKVTGNSRGFGFVTFAEAAAVTDCVGAEKHIIDGQEADVRRAVPKGHIAGKGADDDQQNKVFVGGIPESLTEDRIASFLSERFGSVKKVSLMHDKNTGRCRGFGFVTFLFPHSAHNCVGKHDVDGHVIEVKRAEPRYATAKPLMGDDRRGDDRMRRSRDENGYDRHHPASYGALPEVDAYGAGPMRRGHYPPALRPAARAEYDAYAASSRAYAPPSDPYAVAPGVHYAHPTAAAPVAASLPTYGLPPATGGAPAPYMVAAPSSPTSAHPPASTIAVYQQMYPAHSVAAEQAPPDAYGQDLGAAGSTGAAEPMVDPYDMRSAASVRQPRYVRPPTSRGHPY